MRIVFLGTPPEAAVALQALVRAGHDVAMVVTQPDRRRGRGGRTLPSPVRRAADDLGLDVRTPERAREVVDDLRNSGAELGVVVAFGQLLPDDVLAAIPHGFVNVHFSLLPRWRGAAPVERAILAGDTETGVCLMDIVTELDAGPVYACESMPIGPGDTAGQLRAELAERGAALLVDTLEAIPSTEATPQEGEPTYADKLDPAEFELDWDRTAAELDRVVRAGNPRPGAWTTVDGQRLKVLRARRVPDPPSDAPPPGTLLEAPAVATAEGRLELVEVQPAGKQAMAADAWARGLHDVERLGT